MADRFVVPPKFLLTQAIDIAPAFIAAAIAGLLTWDKTQLRRDENLRFLLWFTLGPPLATAFISLATGLGIRDMWGAPMWNLVGLVIVQANVARRHAASLSRLGYCLIALFIIGLLGYAVANVLGPEFENKPSRIQWPDRALSQSFAAAWQSRTDHPLRIVAADSWLGGLVAMRAEPRPSVWIDGSFIKSPWITPQAVARDGVLVLWRIRNTDAPPTALASLPRLKILGVKSFAWPRTPGAAPLRIGYGIVPPVLPLQ